MSLSIWLSLNMKSHCDEVATSFVMDDRTKKDCVEKEKKVGIRHTSKKCIMITVIRNRNIP